VRAERGAHSATVRMMKTAVFFIETIRSGNVLSLYTTLTVTFLDVENKDSDVLQLFDSQADFSFCSIH
jgi:hypothetical protein